MYLYIHTTEENNQTFLLPLPPTVSVFQPDSWLSVDTAGRRGVLVSAQPGWKEASWPWWACRRLRYADHARWTPDLNGRVIAGRQQQLLVSRAECHRVHHVVVCQAGQTDVVVTVPDVAMLVLCSAIGRRMGDRWVCNTLKVKWFSHCAFASVCYYSGCKECLSVTELISCCFGLHSEQVRLC